MQYSRLSDGRDRVSRPFLVFCAGLVLLSALPASAQVLSYSTYLPDISAGRSIAVNGAGEACVFADILTAKLDSNGSIIYSIAANAPITAVAIDTQGSCYMAGVGIINPTPGAFQSTKPSGGQFVMKVDGAGNTLYATYLGGSGGDRPSGLAVDGDGNVYITGSTASNDFPTLHAFQLTLAGRLDVFMAALNATGTALIYSTYWGGVGDDSSTSIAVDDAKNAYITGSTSTTDFPTVSPLQGALAGGAFVTKLDPSGMPIYSTYLGGPGPVKSAGTAIAADSNGNAYIAGVAGAGLPLANPIQNTTADQSAFVSKLNAGGSALLYSTYLGELTVPTGIAIDSARRVYIAGQVFVNGTSTSGSVPLASPIQSKVGAGTSDGFVTVLNSAGTSLVFSTYLGGDDDTVSGLGIDSATNLYLTGVATGPFPIVNASNGVYLPLVPQSINEFSPSPQGYVLKINLLAGTSLSHPDTVDFRTDPLPVGSFATVEVLLANTSASASIVIANIAITGDYSQTNDCPQTLLPATSCKFQVNFAPTTGGERSGIITITDTAPGSPHVIHLIGSGLVPQVSLSPNTLAFASQVVGTSSAVQIVNLTDTGSASLAISNIATSGDFSESNNCGTGIAPRVTCQISVLFSPTLMGDRTGVLSIIDGASDSPQMVSLSGTGVGTSLGLGVPPGGSSTATVLAGAPATYLLAIGGSGKSGTASLSCTGAPMGANCSVPATENFDAVTPATFTVTVTTTSRSQSALRAPGSLRSSWLWAMAIMALVLPSVGGSKRSIRSKARFLPLLLVLLLCSCGGSGGSNSPANPNGTPAGTYNLTINATSGSNTQSAPLTLVVK